MDTLGTHASNLFWQFLKKNFFFQTRVRQIYGSLL